MSLLLRIVGVVIALIGVLFVLTGLIPSESYPNPMFGMAVFGAIVSAMGVLLVRVGARRAHAPLEDEPTELQANRGNAKPEPNPGSTSGPNERVAKILRSKTDMSDEQIKELSDPEAWRIVYETRDRPRERRTEICFTGFRPSERDELEQLALQNGLKVCKGVTKNLGILITGDEPGPAKLRTARERGNVIIMDAGQFLEFVETGEVP